MTLHTFTMLNRTTLIIASLALASPAFAHEGPRFWLSQSAGKLALLTSDDDYDPQSYAPSSVFYSAFDEFDNTGFGPTPLKTTQFPGFETRRDGASGIANGTVIGFSLAGPLLKLNAAGTALVPSAAEQLEITLGAATTVTSTGVFPGYNFMAAGPGEHGHLTFTLRGDGVTPGGGSDGVYAVPVRATSPTLATSDWAYLILQSNNAAAQRVQAATIANRMATSRPGDANFDGAVNFDDLLILAANYNASAGRWWGTGDFDFNGATNFDDLLKLAANYNTSGGQWSLAQALIPEPACLFASFVGALAMLRRRRVACAAIASTALLASGCDDGQTAAPIPVIAPNAAPTTSPAAQKTASCPLCVGHTIEVTDSTPRFDHSGTTYYFCSDSCKAEFEKDPAKHAQGK